MISISFGLIAGALIGVMYKVCDSRDRSDNFFSDFYLFDVPRVPVAKKNAFESRVGTTQMAVGMPNSYMTR